MKLLAILLGPSGVGLIGIYSLVADFTVSLAGMGAQQSGVRQVAEAVGDSDSARITRLATILNWTSIALGVVGAAMLGLLAVPVSTLTFGNALQAPGIALLGVAVFLRLATGAPSALIQGTRRIRDLANMTILSALLNTVVTIPLVYFFGEAGIVPSLIAMAFTSLLAAMWYRRRIATPPASLSMDQVRVESKTLLTLGFAFMASGLVSVGAAYLIRVLILQRSGVEAAGLYQAAWAIGGLYAGFILQAMGTDFYPRLTGAVRDHAQCNRLVNEQAQVSMLLAGPGLLATMTLAPLVISLFYTAEFQPAVSLLRWLCLGMLLRIIAWPIGFIILAKGAQKMMFWTEAASSVVNVILAWLLLPWMGLDGAGAAFVGLYIWHGVLVYVLVRRLSDFRWSSANLKLGALFMAAGALNFCAEVLLPFWPATLIGLAATAAASLYSITAVVRLLPPEFLQSVIPRQLTGLVILVTRRRVDPAE